jgi:hypothetical protein
MTQKNPHGVLAGPTDESGDATLLREFVERNVWRVIQTSPMDYKTLEHWDGSVHVRAMGRALVDSALNAIAVRESLGSLETEENLQSLKEYREALENIAGDYVKVKATCRPHDAAVVTTEDAVV